MACLNSCETIFFMTEVTHFTWEILLLIYLLQLLKMERLNDFLNIKKMRTNSINLAMLGKMSRHKTKLSESRVKKQRKRRNRTTKMIR
jgi:hypothetical protein